METGRQEHFNDQGEKIEIKDEMFAILRPSADEENASPVMNDADAESPRIWGKENEQLKSPKAFAVPKLQVNQGRMPIQAMQSLSASPIQGHEDSGSVMKSPLAGPDGGFDSFRTLNRST